MRLELLAGEGADDTGLAGALDVDLAVLELERGLGLAIEVDESQRAASKPLAKLGDRSRGRRMKSSSSNLLLTSCAKSTRILSKFYVCRIIQIKMIWVPNRFIGLLMNNETYTLCGLPP